MNIEAARFEEDLQLTLRCVEGDKAALETLHGKYHEPLTRIVMARGFSPTEATDFVADVWSDCVPKSDEHLGLLNNYQGRCKLVNWLGIVVTNRWLDQKRKQSRTIGNQSRSGDVENVPELSEVADPLVRGLDDSLLNVLRDSLLRAFSRCPPKLSVLLRLRDMYRIEQRMLLPVTRMKEYEMSRVLKAARAQIRKDTLAEIKKTDPWLDLTWQDFMDLCESYNLDFL